MALERCVAPRGMRRPSVLRREASPQLCCPPSLFLVGPKALAFTNG